MKCLACQSTLKVVYYQRRAADEPPDKVVYCENCPLDISRLSLSTENVTKHNITKIPAKIEKTLSSKPDKDKGKRSVSLFSSMLTKTRTATCIKVEGSAAQKCYNQIKNSNVFAEHVIGSFIQITTGTKFNTSYYYHNSTLHGKALLTESSSTIAPYVIKRTVNIYELSSLPKCDIDKYMVAKEYKLDSIPNCESSILRLSHDDQRPYILLVLPSNSKDEIVLSTLQEILIRYGTEYSIKSIVSNTTLNTLYAQSGRAYDHPFAPKTGYTYTWKPDGERFWYIKYGFVWLFCRRLLSGRIAGWTMATKLQPASYIGPILDVEVMIAHPPILIDVLANNMGDTTLPSRTLDSILSEFNMMKDIGSVDIPIFVREYYRSISELSNTKDSLQYPVDGIVGIEDGSMTIIKVKTEKSIELELKENGDLVSSDDYQIATSDLQNTYSPGSIIEIRFGGEDNANPFTINSTLLRTDKVKANDYQACRNIITTASDTPNSLAMRKAVLWCNSIRQKLNQIASRVSGKGRVILDIGAGDGQSVSDYSTNPEVTYILLEPNMRKCKQMIRRLQENKKGICRLYSDARSIITAAGLVSTGKLKYAVICATLKDILSQQHCMRTLKSCIRCCIASFSISYTVPELQDLAINGINVIGCGYMYDSVDHNGILINEYGVVMKYTNYRSEPDNKEAVVNWGSDKPYNETGIVLNDFNGIYHCKLARTVVPVISTSSMTLLNTISDKVYIITSSKYM